MTLPPSFRALPHHDTAARKSVLLVEDDESVARLFHKTLESASYEVVLVSDGREAKRLIEKSSFDAIVTDISLPSLNGIELLELVRARDDRVPVVLVTGNPGGASAGSARDQADHCLVKPVRPLELRRVVAEVINAQRAARADTVDAPAPGPHRRDVALERAYAVYQPIVHLAASRIIGYSVYPRTSSRSSRPDRPAASASSADAEPALGKRVWSVVADDLPLLDDHARVVLNLHPTELDDDDLLAPNSALSRCAGRVVLAISAREDRNHIEAIGTRVDQLRERGFSLGVEDLPCDVSALTRMASLEPDLVRIDLEPIREIDESPFTREWLRSMVLACSDAGIELVFEGVETEREVCALSRLGAVLFQGSVFATPRRAAHWSLLKYRDEPPRRLGKRFPSHLGRCRWRTQRR